MKARALALAALLLPLAGCAGEVEHPDVVVPYPRLGDVATYAVDGSHVQLARWENGHAFQLDGAQVRFTLGESAAVIDGARDVHEAFHVLVEEAETGIFVRHADLYVSPRHQALVQAYYPLSQDQGVLSFDERGFPWLFGTSALFGAELSRVREHPFTLPDNLGRAQTFELAWVVAGDEELDGVATTRLRLEGHASIEGDAWFERGSAWPLRVRLTLKDAGLAPHVRVDGEYPATLDARRTALVGGATPLPPRDRGAGFGEDLGVERVAWDRRMPPDGDAGQIAYALADAYRDATLLDKPFADWVAAAADPRVYRGTYADAAGDVDGTSRPSWLIQVVDRDERYYEVVVERITLAAVAQGVPRIVSSGPAEPPKDPNHGWFAAEGVPPSFVPLSEGVRVVKEVFGAPDVQIFLRSLQDPPGYSYYIDGGFEVENGRYTVVYDPNTGFIQEATGPVSVRFVSN